MSPADLLPGLPWATPYLTLPWLAHHEPQLHDSPPLTGPPLSIIIPARNESATIATVVQSILATSYPVFELIVVDDCSTDDTAAQVQAIARSDPRVRLVHGAARPPGWYGKPWACDQGYRAARENLLIFTDADTSHHPALLCHAVGALELHQAGMVTVAPFQRCEGFWERLVMPQIWLLLSLRYHPKRVSSATRARDVIANGQFILVTREAYETVGTHEAVRNQVAEDLALAQAFFKAGRKVYFAFAQDLMETRMYRSLPHLIEGWSKNAYLGGRRSFPEEPVLRALVPLLLVGAMLFWLLPPIGALLGLAMGDDSLIRAALLPTALSAVFWGLISHGMRIPAQYGLLYPLGALVGLYIMLRSIWRGERQVEWRGRVYRAG